jgi:hypothetical protein
MNDKRVEADAKSIKPFEKLTPVIKEMLMLTAKTTWKMMKLTIKGAYYVPGAVRKLAIKIRESNRNRKAV